MTFRCPARTGLDGKVRTAAETIGSPRPDIEWSPYDVFQCLVEDVPHDFHAAFLRTGARAAPESDVYLCWRDGSPVQWLADIDVCLKKPAPSVPDARSTEATPDGASGSTSTRPSSPPRP